MAVGACADDPLSITAPDASAKQTASGAPSELGKALLARFTVDVGVTGDLRPGQPVTLQVTARGVFATQDVEVRLMLPEVAAAKLSSWNEVVIPIGTPLPAEALWRTPLPAGASVVREATVSIPRAGYYMVVASVLKKSAEPDIVDGKLVQTVAHRELWRWIDPKGGRTTPSFDWTIFPQGYRIQHGPSSRMNERSPVRAGSGSGDVGTMDITPGYVTFRLTYYNNDRYRYDPVAKATVTINQASGPSDPAEVRRLWRMNLYKESL